MEKCPKCSWLCELVPYGTSTTSHQYHCTECNLYFITQDLIVFRNAITADEISTGQLKL